jgi:hypothetical protein
MTLALQSVSLFTIAFPIPPEPPVTMITLFFRDLSDILITKDYVQFSPEEYEARKG